VTPTNVVAPSNADLETRVSGDPRPSWDAYYNAIAIAVSARGDCTRRQVGAIIVVGDDIVATGYNGAPMGEPGCLSAGACPRGSISVTELPHGSSYDTGAGACIAIHAEQNAILRAGRKARGGMLYVTTTPCDGCLRLIKGTGIFRIVVMGKPFEF
jgi:dCMP deaminase